ncbi:hypothetical protein RBSH_01156 [Rhodopirellula baltica SH28]|uniref:Uncharacterized protein n=1 Tax=Rhodopirellula baltica SH28 TaxID=993517 RepID=K5DAC4_RHOBT|nr:hypothetical protein RBSH_01156 [Rhodopirellula baltica SH28]
MVFQDRRVTSQHAYDGLPRPSKISSERVRRSDKTVEETLQARTRPTQKPRVTSDGLGRPSYDRLVSLDGPEGPSAGRKSANASENAGKLVFSANHQPLRR